MTAVKETIQDRDELSGALTTGTAHCILNIRSSLPPALVQGSSDIPLPSPSTVRPVLVINLLSIYYEFFSLDILI